MDKNADGPLMEVKFMLLIYFRKVYACLCWVFCTQDDHLALIGNPCLKGGKDGGFGSRLCVLATQLGRRSCRAASAVRNSL